MSTILDALRKAEAERQSGSMPAIQAPVAAFFVPSSADRRWWWAAALALLIATFSWVWLSGGTKNPVSSDIPAEIPIEIPAEAPDVAIARADPQTAPPQEKTVPEKPAEPADGRANRSTSNTVNSPKRESVKEPVPEPATKSAQPPARQQPVAVADPAPAVPAKPANHDVTPAVASQPAKPVPAKAAPEPSLPTLHELPQHLQREIPTFTLDGYMYSGNKTGRSVLIGRRLLHEGDRIAPGLVLERMTPTHMVLNYKGHRYRAHY